MLSNTPKVVELEAAHAAMLARSIDVHDYDAAVFTAAFELRAAAGRIAAVAHMLIERSALEVPVDVLRAQLSLSDDAWITKGGERVSFARYPELRAFSRVAERLRAAALAVALGEPDA